MFEIKTKLNTTEIEERRMDLLKRLEAFHPLSVFEGLEQSRIAAFIIGDKAARSIRRALAEPRYRLNESAGLAKVKIAARTPDATGYVYQIESFHFESLGTADGVISAERDELNEGEIEVHSHVFSRPDYLGKTDIGDLIACVEGPAWHCPRPQPMDTAVRIFGIISIYASRFAHIQFYRHDLRDDLSLENNFGLKKLGMAISLPNAF
jgi:hypothetical protein